MSATEGLMDFLFLSLHQGCDIGSNKGDPIFSESPIASMQSFATDMTNWMYSISASDYYWDLLCCLMIESPILVDVLGWWEWIVIAGWKGLLLQVWNFWNQEIDSCIVGGWVGSGIDWVGISALGTGQVGICWIGTRIERLLKVSCGQRRRWLLSDIWEFIVTMFWSSKTVHFFRNDAK